MKKMTKQEAVEKLLTILDTNPTPDELRIGYKGDKTGCLIQRVFGFVGDSTDYTAAHEILEINEVFLVNMNDKYVRGYITLGELRDFVASL